MQQGTVAQLLGTAGARVRVSVTGVNAGDWHAPHAPESSQTGILTFILADHDTGDAVVKKALAAGGRLLAYEPLHPDLETVFLQQVGAAA